MARSKTAASSFGATSTLLGEMVSRIVERFHPEKIILFGSHAWGTPRDGSDVDLLVVMESDRRPAERSARISTECRPRFLPMDIIVRTPAELEHRLKINDPFLRRVVEEGTVLYER